MRSWKIANWIAGNIGVACLVLVSGCGSKNTANVITVTVTSSSGTNIIVGSSTTLTATVTGATNLGLTWETPQFTTTTVTNGKSTTSNPQNFPTDGSLGTLTNQTTTSPATATYTAPNQLPDQTKYPGLQLVITVQSQQDTKKTGKITLTLNSGITTTLTPPTASVPVNEQQAFTVSLTNDLQSQGVTWLLTQQTATATTTEPNLTKCDPGCGTLSNTTATTATYTAPSSVPTACTPAPASGTTCAAANLTIVATPKADNTRFATGTITIVQGGPITFNGITPTIAPQGATLWDIYLDAPNFSSASKITLTDQNGGSRTLDSSTGQIKVLFPIPTSSTPNPTSTGARLRLLESDLQGLNTSTPTTYAVTISDPAECGSTGVCAGSFSFTLMPVRPTSISSSPNSVVQNGNSNDFPLSIDGGYFGPGGQFAIATFAGNTILQNSGSTSNSRRLNLSFPTSSITAPSAGPGLYPLSISRTTPPLPSPNNPSVTTLGVFPDYSSTTPTLSTPVAVATLGKNPSAIDIDPTLGVAVVADTGSNQVEFFDTTTLASIGTPVTVAALPTGVSVNRNNHTVAVISYGIESNNVTTGQTITVMSLPRAPSTITTYTVDLSSLVSGVSPAPLPYAIGVDPDTNLALVAYSSTSTSSFGNLGFVVNLNQGSGAPFGCPLQDILTPGTAPNAPPCVYSQVTLNSGAYPQIAMAPHGHMGYVTPGGLGTVRGIDLTRSSAKVDLGTVTLTAGGSVTVTTANSTQLTGLVPGIPATVLITGVPSITSGSTQVNVNGVFSISVTSSTSFTYSLGNISSSASGTTSGGTLFFGSPNLVFAGISQTTQGVAINPITHTAALADPNATGQNGPQIDLLNQLDQSVNSISFFAQCTAYTQSCTNAPELLGTTGVAWQPYTNAVVSYNPTLNQVSVSDPVTQRRRAFACAVASCTTTSSSLNQITLPGTGTAQLTVQNGTTGTLKLWGGIALDPSTNQALVVQSGSNTILGINLGTIKPAEITEVVVPSATGQPGTIGGVPNAFLPQGTLTSSADLAGVQIFGSGFVAGAQVRLDTTPLPSANVQVVSATQLTVTIPASFLSAPHRYALDVISNNVSSNATDFMVVQAVDMTPACTTGPPQPSSVALADQLKNGTFSPIAVVSNTGCNNISVLDVNPGSATFGTILNSISVGTAPQGVAVSEHLGMAVVANNSDGTVSIVDLTKGTQPVPAVATGKSPTGIAINDATGVAFVANFGSNTVSEINLALLLGSSPPSSLTAVTIGGVQQPIAVAIDPDRGTNNQGLAVVTALQLLNGSSPLGALFPVDIGLATPVLSTSISVGSVNSTPTGIVFDPAVSTGTANPGVFFVSSSGTNQIFSYNPDSGSAFPANVGINPTALAVNPQTGAILTSNFAGQSISMVDTLSNPFKTRQTLGLPGSPQFGVAIDQFTNLAVIVDRGNNRVLLFALPN
jgi:DNA-binding beta-propeller fold protein YncE